MAKARFAADFIYKTGARVYIRRRADESEPGLLTTNRDEADARHPEPVGVIAAGPLLKLTKSGEQLLAGL